MDIMEHEGQWRIAHAGKVIAQPFATEAEANTWADCNIDDQMFDTPNSFMPPLEYDPDLVSRRVTKSGEA